MHHNCDQVIIEGQGKDVSASCSVLGTIFSILRVFCGLVLQIVLRGEILSLKVNVWIFSAVKGLEMFFR